MTTDKTSLRTCVFCGRLLSGNRSKEHIFPQKLQEHLALVDQPLFPTLYSATGEVDRYRKMTFNGYVSGHVCHHCNTGWMSALEKEAKPLLVSLIDGAYSGTLNADKSRLLSFWIFKTALALHSASIQGIFIPTSHYRVMNERGSIPDQVIIAITQVTGQDGFFWIQSQNWSGKTDDISLEDLKKTYKIAFRIGQLAARVHYWPFKERYIHDFLGNSIGYIWSCGPRSITWPPSRSDIKTVQEFDESLFVGNKIDRVQ